MLRQDLPPLLILTFAILFLALAVLYPFIIERSGLDETRPGQRLYAEASGHLANGDLTHVSVGSRRPQVQDLVVI